MKIARTIFAVSSVAFVAGFWTACSVGFDPTGDDYQFSCNTDQDCISPKACVNNICVNRGGGDNCVDADGDGYGVGETGDCPKCTEQGDCREDCNDSDEGVNPGLLDNCDGKDNNCDGEIDEVLTCEDFTDCPDEPPYLSTCNTTTGQCEYKAPIQTPGTACFSPVACVNGERPSPGDECF